MLTPKRYWLWLEFCITIGSYLNTPPPPPPPILLLWFTNCRGQSLKTVQPTTTSKEGVVSDGPSATAPLIFLAKLEWWWECQNGYTQGWPQWLRSNQKHSVFAWTSWIDTHGSQLALERHHTVTMPQRPESCIVTLTWHASKYKAHKLCQRYILRLAPSFVNSAWALWTLVCFRLWQADSVHKWFELRRKKKVLWGNE